MSGHEVKMACKPALGIILHLLSTLGRTDSPLFACHPQLCWKYFEDITAKTQQVLIYFVFIVFLLTPRCQRLVVFVFCFCFFVVFFVAYPCRRSCQETQRSLGTDSQLVYCHLCISHISVRGCALFCQLSLFASSTFSLVLSFVVASGRRLDEEEPPRMMHSRSSSVSAKSSPASASPFCDLSKLLLTCHDSQATFVVRAMCHQARRKCTPTSASHQTR